MEKTIFLFRRKQGRSRADFGAYYVGHHAPLGRRLTRCLLGYTVNITESDGGPDAVTEHWLERAIDLLTPDIAYASREDFDAVVADDATLFDGFELYVATGETVLVLGDPGAFHAGERTPGKKAIWCFRDVADLPPPPPGARRVVDTPIDHRLVFSERGPAPAPSDIAVIRMAWADDVAAFGADAADAWIVAEYRQIEAPDRASGDGHG